MITKVGLQSLLIEKQKTTKVGHRLQSLLIDYKIPQKSDIDYKTLQKSDIDYKSLLIPLITVIYIYLLGPLLTKGHPKSACPIHLIQGRYFISTLQCPTYSCRNPAGIHSFQWNSSGIQSFQWNSCGIPVESCRNPVIPVEFHWIPQEFLRNSTGFHWNSTGIKQNKVEKPYLNASICI
jgi:hypothetical protein